MQWRHTLALATTVLLGLMALMISVDAHAQIAFVSEKHGNREIYVMDANGNNHRRITNNFWDDDEPSWSPDGKRIAFVSGRDRNLEIYVMNADGNNHRRITNNFWDDSDPKWFSPIFSVVPAGKTLTTWGWFKQGPR